MTEWMVELTNEFIKPDNNKLLYYAIRKVTNIFPLEIFIAINDGYIEYDAEMEIFRIRNTDKNNTETVVDMPLEYYKSKCLKYTKFEEAMNRPVIIEL